MTEIVKLTLQTRVIKTPVKQNTQASTIKKKKNTEELKIDYLKWTLAFDPSVECTNPA